MSAKLKENEFVMIFEILIPPRVAIYSVFFCYLHHYVHKLRIVKRCEPQRWLMIDFLACACLWLTIGGAGK